MATWTDKNYGTGHENPPDAIREKLGLALPLRDGETVEALALELKLGGKSIGPALDLVLAELVDSLDEVLRTGTQVLEDRSKPIAEKAVGKMSLADLDSVFADLEWGDYEIRRVQVRDLPRVMRGVLVERLSANIMRMLLRWEKQDRRGRYRRSA